MATLASGPAMSFTGENKAAQRFAERHAASRVTLVTRDQRATLRTLVAQSIREGIAPYDLARLIRSVVGLNAQQAHAVVMYRAGLLEMGIGGSRAASLVERFTARKLRERAETIARTELMMALNAGARAEWRRNERSGLLGRKPVVEWLTTGDDRACPQCSALDGARVALGKLFRGGLSGPPAHPRCRCSASVSAE